MNSIKSVHLTTMLVLSMALLTVPVFAAGGDETATISSPVNGINTTDTTPEIDFFVNQSNHTEANFVRIYVDGSVDGQVNVTNSTTAKFNISTQTDATIAVIVEFWNETAVTDAEKGSAFNSSEINISIDTTAPTASYASTSVGSGAEIEQDKSHTFAVTVSDATTSPDTCLLYYNDVVETVAVSGGSCSTTKKVLANGNYYYVVNDSTNQQTTTARRYFRADSGVSGLSPGALAGQQTVTVTQGGGNFFANIIQAIQEFIANLFN